MQPHQFCALLLLSPSHRSVLRRAQPAFGELHCKHKFLVFLALNINSRRDIHQITLSRHHVSKCQIAEALTKSINTCTKRTHFKCALFGIRFALQQQPEVAQHLRLSLALDRKNPLRTPLGSSCHASSSAEGARKLRNKHFEYLSKQEQ